MADGTKDKFWNNQIFRSVMAGVLVAIIIGAWSKTRDWIFGLVVALWAFVAGNAVLSMLVLTLLAIGIMILLVFRVRKVGEQVQKWIGQRNTGGWTNADRDHVVVSICEPSVNLNRTNNYFRLSIPLEIRNFTGQDFTVLSCECEITIDSYSLGSVARSIPMPTATNSRTQYWLEKELTDADVRRIEERYNGESVRHAYFRMEITIRTKHGHEVLRINKQHSMQRRAS